MTVNADTRTVEVTRSPGGRLTVVLDGGFEPDEVLAALVEAAEPPPDDRPAAHPRPVRQSPRHYAGEFLG